MSRAKEAIMAMHFSDWQATPVYICGWQLVWAPLQNSLWCLPVIWWFCGEYCILFRNLQSSSLFTSFGFSSDRITVFIFLWLVCYFLILSSGIFFNSLLHLIELIELGLKLVPIQFHIASFWIQLFTNLIYSWWLNLAYQDSLLLTYYDWW
jgi:hypothetical protein